ncbi:hypothetical protein L1D14_16875 [Vibrio tubiashii]|uniref:hypothetical protein n=1 Tax=Vibrio tubiashii TaxID=29498 RepID=UPI001EFC379E|nr:hypothetical protein [Vibrio tubiashii]MCG9577889.1 hypothetical protein [Vibrio tubiashii]
MVKKDEAVRFYENMRSHYATYYNNKEIAAWAGLVLYVLFCSLIIGSSLPTEHEGITAALLFIAVLGVTYTVFVYIRNQLTMRDIGGATCSAALLIQSEILLSDKTDFSEYIIVVESSDCKAQSSHALPSFLIQKRDLMNAKGRGFQDASRLSIYSLMAVSIFSVILLKYVSLLG